MAAAVLFPSDIITEILSRLQVKPLLRFRCVSKPWCSLIDSKEFLKKHMKRSVENIKLVLGFQESISSISLDSLYPTGVVSVGNVERLAPLPFPGSVMLNSCNGLSILLIEKPQASQLFIWNPFTGKYRQIPVNPIECPDRLLPIRNSLIANDRFAFAYVSETDEYKIVRVMEFTRPDGTWLGSWMGSEAKMFSSTSNMWEGIPDFPYRLSYKRVWGAHLNGILHTVVHNASSDWSIMGFDVKSKQHAMVPNPDFGVRSIAGLTVDVLGGSLSLTNQDFHDPKVDVWVMKHYGVKDSWGKLLSVVLASFQFVYGSFRYSATLQPLAYSKDGEEILLNVIDERCYWYNLRTGAEREVTVNMDSEFYTELCIESLVSFPGFISVGNAKRKTMKKNSKGKKSNNSWGLERDFRVVQ